MYTRKLKTNSKMQRSGYEDQHSKSCNNKFFDIIDTKEVNEQLSLSVFDRQNWKPEVVLHRLKEQRQVADLIC